MPVWLKMLLIVSAAGALLFGLAIGAFAWWLHANRGELREKGIAIETEGKQFGLGKSSQACIDESLTRLERTAGILQQAMLKVFLQNCLQSASRDAALCVGVPPTSEMFRSATWRNDVCAAHGRANDPACTQMFSVVQEVCHSTP